MERARLVAWRPDRLLRILLVPPRAVINRSLASVLLGLVPVMFLLLRLGEPHGLTDRVGVIVAGGFWFCLPGVLNPWILDGNLTV